MNMRAVLQSFRQQATQFLADPQWIIPSVFSPFMFTMVILFIYQDVTGPVVLQAVLGGGVLGMWANTLFASSYTISFDRMNGTLEVLLASPTDLTDIIVGRSLWNTFIGIITALMVFIFAELIFRTGMTLSNPFLFFVMLVLTLFSLSMIGMVFSAAFVFSRRSYILTGVFEYPIYVLSGALVPITVLPGWAQSISYVLAPAWSVDALKLSADSTYTSMMTGSIVVDIIVSVVLSLVYFIIARYLLSMIGRNIRETGSATRY